MKKFVCLWLGGAHDPVLTAVVEEWRRALSADNTNFKRLKWRPVQKDSSEACSHSWSTPQQPLGHHWKESNINAQWALLIRFDYIRIVVWMYEHHIFYTLRTETDLHKQSLVLIQIPRLTDIVEPLSFRGDVSETHDDRVLVTKRTVSHTTHNASQFKHMPLLRGHRRKRHSGTKLQICFVLSSIKMMHYFLNVG